MPGKAQEPRECLVFEEMDDSDGRSPSERGEVSSVAGSRSVCETCPSILKGFFCTGRLALAVGIDSKNSPITASLVDVKGKVVAEGVPVCKHVGERIVLTAELPD